MKKPKPGEYSAILAPEGYSYSLLTLQIRGDRLATRMFSAPEISKLSEKLKFVSINEIHVHIRNRSELLSLTEGVLATSREKITRLEYKIFDLSNDTGRETYAKWHEEGVAKFNIYQTQKLAKEKTDRAIAQTESAAKAKAKAKKAAEAKAKFLQDRQAEKAIYGGKWTMVGDDIMGDGTKQLIGLPTEYSGTDQGPIIRFSCVRGKTLFDITWPAPLAAFHSDENGFKYVRFELRNNQGQIRSLIGVPSESRRQLFEMNGGRKTIAALEFGLVGIFQPAKKNVDLGWTAKQLSQSWATANRIVIRSQAVNGQTMTAAYGMAGYREA